MEQFHISLEVGLCITLDLTPKLGGGGGEGVSEKSICLLHNSVLIFLTY